MNDKEILNRLEKIELRNKKVETEKAWEVSTERKISITVITYFIIVIIMFLLKFENIFINAIIPTTWYLLSTLWINPMKKVFLKRYK